MNAYYSFEFMAYRAAFSDILINHILLDLIAKIL